METGLYEAIKAINVENLSEDEKKELLKIFQVTENSLIRNRIAIIFSDSHYNEAIPYIIKKINDKDLYNYNGTLVWALGNLDSKKYFTEFIKIICEQAYEARLWAYGAVEDFTPIISNTVKKEALKILEEFLNQQEEIEDDKYENSTLHFIEQTIKLLS